MKMKSEVRKRFKALHTHPSSNTNPPKKNRENGQYPSRLERPIVTIDDVDEHETPKMEVTDTKELGKSKMDDSTVGHDAKVTMDYTVKRIVGHTGKTGRYTTLCAGMNIRLRKTRWSHRNTSLCTLSQYIGGESCSNRQPHKSLRASHNRQTVGV